MINVSYIEFSKINTKNVYTNRMEEKCTPSRHFVFYAIFQNGNKKQIKDIYHNYGLKFGP